MFGGTRALAVTAGSMLSTAVASLALAASASGAAPCTAPASPGGEWPMYGQNLADTHDQTAEHTIDASAAKGLKAAWVFKTGSLKDDSAFQTVPVVAGGCAFIGSAAGNVFAIKMSDGSLVWRRHIDVPKPGLGGAIVGAAAVTGSTVIVLVNQSGGPYALALDRSTGAVAWQSAPYVTTAGYYTNSSPIVANGLVVAGWSPPEGSDSGQGGYALIDAATGAIVKATDVIPAADQAQGYAGAGMWSTPAYDTATKFLYWGAGNPDSKTKEHAYTNAILKIDLHRSSPSFGDIVAAYKGNVDQYTKLLQTLSKSPLCALSDLANGAPYPLDDPLCGQLDLDFGASANLFTLANGTKVVGELQKSGVYHVARADTMAPVWTRIVGISCQFCNAASTAVDGTSVFGVSTPGGFAFALNQNTGAQQWFKPVLDLVHYQSTTVADGVVYTLDGNGFLDAFNAANGASILKHQTSADAGTITAGLPFSNGVAVAEHTVLAPMTSFTSGGASTIASYGGVNLPVPPGEYLIAYRVK
jgi:polyvinyl alcohol dehydrogenase (cytochrome)